jgi:hypothetical protein
MRAFPRITERDGAPDAGTGSGDDGDVAGEKRHGISPAGYGYCRQASSICRKPKHRFVLARSRHSDLDG